MLGKNGARTTPASGGHEQAEQAGRQAQASAGPTRHFDFSSLSGPERYRLLTSSIMPRPIAWVVTCAADGGMNAAPYSFFNVFGADPPVLAIGILPGPCGRKDTAANILATREFVVNLVPFALAREMSATSVEAPPEVDELALADLATLPSLAVRPPRIALSPVTFECRLTHGLETGTDQFLMVGEVLHAHFAQGVLTGNPDRPRIDAAALDLVGRMHGPATYARTRETFEMARPAWRDSAETQGRVDKEDD
ncbi:flavin reductase family protein [Aureimonas populi]|uniref:Flavin reductase family protein n=1 Tax=Aureimonas populi TaxID=1701758 RepID=A0ABW5CNN6_9HYPH|nr:flavin reductase family protein [Aureimonas populi]